MPDTILTQDDAPPDRIIRRIKPKLLSEQDGKAIYDAGENISGFVVLESCAGYGEEVHIRFAENLQDGALSYGSTGSHYKGISGKPQIMEDVFIGDGSPRIFAPQFVWHAFRYFEITGSGKPVCVAVVHSDTPPAAAFHSSSPALNWLFDAYRRTQLNNMHGGVPSDCPHRERLGYTGDGQICVPAAMIMLDSQAFYRKWIRDIFDSQDPQTGHVNHTAPFAGGGGGPGGWGCAAVLVPYHYYKTYGDRDVPAAYFDRMLLWIEYLNAHSENGLVVREEEGGWCLGDWCTLEKTVIPVPLVNTCYFIKSLRHMEEMAAVVGREDVIPALQKYRHAAETGVISAYYDPASGSFAEGIQGADAFALWAGLGDSRTFGNLVEKYRTLGHFDTGFLGTEILSGLLWERDEADLAYTLLTSHEKGSFGYMMDHQATTIWEDWHGGGSHDHPMFGACAGHLLTAILGIRQAETSAAYRDLLIAPKIPAELAMAEGSVNLAVGTVSVRWQHEGDLVRFIIVIPENTTAVFVFRGQRKPLVSGKHDFVL